MLPTCLAEYTHRASLFELPLTAVASSEQQPSASSAPPTAVAASEQQQSALAAPSSSAVAAAICAAYERLTVPDQRRPARRAQSLPPAQRAQSDCDRPMAVIVSCPSLPDWECKDCVRVCTEKDSSRKWVHPRKCPHCGRPMSTWRTPDSICSIFKPPGAEMTPREKKSHRARLRPLWEMMD